MQKQFDGALSQMVKSLLGQSHGMQDQEQFDIDAQADREAAEVGAAREEENAKTN